MKGKLLWNLLDGPDTGSEPLCTTQAYGCFVSLAKPVVPSSHVQCGYLENKVTGLERAPVGDAREVPQTRVRRLDELCRFILNLFFPLTTVLVNN